MSERPRLRPLDVFPVEHEGRRFLALRDPAGYTAAVLLLPPPLLEIVSLFDGEHEIADIQAALVRHRGELVEAAAIERLAHDLDEHGLLDSPGFAERRAAVDRAFLDAPRRPATHAGGAYPEEPAALRRLLDGFFTGPDGPGPVCPSDEAPAVGGLVAPHIDYQRGGAAYAWGYRELAQRCPADVFVVFGTCHAGMRDPFALTRKGFETPLGTVPVEADLVETLAARAGQDCFASELAHRGEHSIELQAVFLQHLFAGRRDLAMVPVLTSFVHEAMAGGRRPEHDRRVGRFFDALQAAVQGCGRKVAYVAGADLAHVGPRFGDPEPLSPTDLERLRQDDHRMLAAVEAGDAGAFFDEAARDDDRRRICGLSPIWSLLRATGGAPGITKRYGQWPDPQAVVTFASVVF